MPLRVGPAGWSYKDWEGVVYPKDPPRSFDQLAYLSHYFDTIEVNTTFYRPPNPFMAKSWRERVAHNADFKFTAKLWGRFTHEKEMYSGKEVEEFKKGIEPLLEHQKLGALLLQFPWSFKNFDAERTRLERLISTFEEYPLVLEVRHASWARDEVLEFLREHTVGFCNIDQPVMGRSIKPSAVVTSSVGYLRLHGRNYENWFRKDAGRDARYDYLYAPKEIETLAGLAEEIHTTSKETYIITNNHYQGKAVTNALEIQHKLTGEAVKVPPPLFAEYPRLKDIAAS